MTHNQFAGRTLTANDRLPVSPNASTRRRRRKPLLPFSVKTKTLFTGNPSGHPTHFNSYWADNSILFIDAWGADATSTEGWPSLILANYDPLTQTFYGSLEVNYGGGLSLVDTTFAAPFDGTTPFDSGQLAWHSWTGWMQIFGDGHWSL